MLEITLTNTANTSKENLWTMRSKTQNSQWKSYFVHKENRIRNVDVPYDEAQKVVPETNLIFTGWFWDPSIRGEGGKCLSKEKRNNVTFNSPDSHAHFQIIVIKSV